MPRAPTSYNWSISWLTLPLARRRARPPLLVMQRGNGRALKARRDGHSGGNLLDRNVVIHEHVALGGKHTLQSAA